jgi:molybdate transport system ATP-binding protein
LNVGAGIRARFSIRRPGFHLDVDLHLPGSGVTALLGPSGAGKTLFLRTLAGLDRVRDGYVAVNGEVWQDDASAVFVPTHRRALGYVFQEASLFPHLNVRGNLEYGMRRAGVAAGDLPPVAAQLGIESLLERRPDHLSGGERQRVAIARALLLRPKLLLFDEPLASLDLARREEILPYLERLHDALRVPCVYVTHMPEEAIRLADHLVLLDRGNVVASGPLRETLARLDLPAPFAADAATVIEATPVAHDAADSLTELRFSGGPLFVARRVEPARDKVRCRILARDVSITLQRQIDTSILNIFPAVVAEIADTAPGAQVLVRLDCNGTSLLAQVTRRSCSALRLTRGKPVWAQVKAVAVIR